MCVGGGVNNVTELLVIGGIGIFIFGLFRLTQFDFFRSILSYYLPFWIGILMGQYNKLNRLVTENAMCFLAAFTGFCLIEGLFFSNAGMLGKGVRLICGILALPVMFNLFNQLQLPEKVNNAMYYVGKNTLPIYVMQFTFLRGMLEIKGLNLFYQIVAFSIISILMIAFILLITRLLGSNQILRQVLLGKR